MRALAAFGNSMQIRKKISTDIPWIESVMTEHFGSPEVVSRGVLHDARVLPGFVAVIESEPAGLLQYRMDENQCEVVVLISLIRRQGIGRELLKTIESVASQAGCDRLWLITTNNNRGAIAFYQAVGWRQVAIHQGVVRESRKIKPQIPLYDEEGIAIEDEIEFEWTVDRK
jgi:GNAT superfamily N-acetyltransferase